MFHSRKYEDYAQRSFLTEPRVGSYGTSGKDLDAQERWRMNNPAILSQIHDKNSFEELRREGKKTWINLPSSVNGTLIYFLLVENNSWAFETWPYITSLFFVGTPVFVTFYLQFLLLITIWASVPNYAEDENICKTSGWVQWAVMGNFMIILSPSLSSILNETLCILRTSRVAFQSEDDLDNMVLYSLKNDGFKKYLTFFLIVVPETIILTMLFYIGSGFILTSESMGDIIINSVAVAFIMDIDNFCVEAFQLEAVSERSNGTSWETTWNTEDQRLSDGIPRKVDNILIATFTNVKKVSSVIILSAMWVAGIKLMYCL